MPKIQGPPDRLTDEEVNAVCDAPPHLGPTCRFLVETGIRWSEALRAQVSDIQNGALVIHQTKSGKVRRIPLSPAAREVLRDRIGQIVPVRSLSYFNVDPFIYRERVVSLATWSGDSIQVAYRVQGSNGADFAVDDISVGTYTATGPPSNETCATAITLPAGEINVDGVTCYATNDIDPFASDGSGCVPTAMDGGDVVYRFTAAAGDWVTASVAAQWNPSVYLLGDCGAPIDSCKGSGFGVEGSQAAELAYKVPVSGTYYLVVDGPAGTCGPFHLSGTISLLLTDVPLDSPGASAPKFNAWPNPSRGVFRMRGTLPVSDGNVSVEIYDASGRLVGTATAEVIGGRFETDLLPAKGRGQSLAAGVYFATVRAGEMKLRRKIVVVR
jgi:Phage integrase family